MQDVHILCRLEQLLSMVKALEAQCDGQQEEVIVLDWGSSYKREVGYIVIEWEQEVDAAFIEQLTADQEVEDFCIYTIPCTLDDQLCLLASTEWEER